MRLCRILSRWICRKASQRSKVKSVSGAVIAGQLAALAMESDGGQKPWTSRFHSTVGHERPSGSSMQPALVAKVLPGHADMFGLEHLLFARVPRVICPIAALASEAGASLLGPPR